MGEKEFIVKDVYEILRQKELDCARLKKEIEALRLVTPLLEDDELMPEHHPHEQENVASDQTGTDGPISSPFSHTGWWKRRRG